MATIVANGASTRGTCGPVVIAMQPSQELWSASCGPSEFPAGALSDSQQAVGSALDAVSQAQDVKLNSPEQAHNSNALLDGKNVLTRNQSAKTQ